MPSDQFSGYELPVGVPFLKYLLNHTYVTSTGASGNHYWACFGRNSGGTLVPGSTGNGDVCVSSNIGDMDTPNPSGAPFWWKSQYAGLTYGWTGVCHQAANRVLVSVPRTISQAKSFLVSFTFFGLYGYPFFTPWQASQFQQEWMNRINDAHNNCKGGQSDEDEPTDGGNSLVELAKNAGGMNEEEFAIAEIEVMLETKLGAEFGKALVDKIRHHQTDLRANAGKLKEALTSTGRRAAISALMELEKKTRTALAEDLGAGMFTTLDNTEPDKEVTIFDISTLGGAEPLTEPKDEATA